MSILVYTANINGRDVIHGQAEQMVEADWLYVTNDPNEVAPEPWRTYFDPIRRAQHPNMWAKWWRTHPPFDGIGHWTPDAPYDHCVWIDAGMEATSHRFLPDAVATCPEDGIAAWQHPRRDCIYEEVEASLGTEAQGGRYDHLPLREQEAFYRAEGYPEHAGLYATGTLVWTRAAAEKIGQAWFDECELWGYQDQVSFPVVCWRAGITPAVFGVGQTAGRFNHRLGWWGNDWMRLHNHRPDTGGA